MFAYDSKSAKEMLITSSIPKQPACMYQALENEFSMGASVYEA